MGLVYNALTNPVYTHYTEKLQVRGKSSISSKYTIYQRMSSVWAEASFKYKTT